MFEQQFAPVHYNPSCSGAPDNVVIIGAGFSGVMAAIQLRRSLPARHVIHLVERSGRFARGLAFAESDAPHLLNVRAANMSAFPDDPGHFERWIVRHGTGWPGETTKTEAGVFATRRLYGRYLRSLLYHKIKPSGGQIKLIADEVENIEANSGGWSVLCASGRKIPAANVVLALGNLSSNRPCDEVVFHDPWTPRAVANLRPDENVLIVGTGLTMIDLALAMYRQGFRGPIVAISRRGLVPRGHEAVERAWPAPDFSAMERRSASALLRKIRREIRKASAQGFGWRAVIDGLRPVTDELWKGMPIDQRRIFLKHLRPYWDVHRHRMAPPVAAMFNSMISSGVLSIKRGCVSLIETKGTVAEVSLQKERLTVQRVIFATGFQGQCRNHSLIANLLASGLVRIDSLELGLEVTHALQAINAQGLPSRGLWAMGPIVRGMFWECLAVPDIRDQAQQIGREVARYVEKEADTDGQIPLVVMMEGRQASR